MNMIVDPYSNGMGVFQTCWNHIYGLAFSLVTVRKVFHKVQRYQITYLLQVLKSLAKLMVVSSIA